MQPRHTGMSLLLHALALISVRKADSWEEILCFWITLEGLGSYSCQEQDSTPEALGRRPSLVFWVLYVFVLGPHGAGCLCAHGPPGGLRGTHGVLGLCSPCCASAQAPEEVLLQDPMYSSNREGTIFTRVLPR